jgi:hypothetical protein
MSRPERTFTTEDIHLERRLPSYWRVIFDMPRSTSSAQNISRSSTTSSLRSRPIRT